MPDLVHLLFLVGGTHPVVDHVMYEPSIFSDWIECVDAARRGELKSESEERRSRARVDRVGTLARKDAAKAARPLGVRVSAGLRGVPARWSRPRSRASTRRG